MNEISFSAENARVMVLAATNRPSDLDEAIIRRFSQAFEIGKPSLSDRTKILKVVLKGERIEDNIDFDRLAGLCEGYTGSDILEACKQAAFIPLREYLQDEKKGEQSQVALSPSIYIYTNSRKLFCSLIIIICFSCKITHGGMHVIDQISVHFVLTYRKTHGNSSVTGTKTIVTV